MTLAYELLGPGFESVAKSDGFRLLQWFRSGELALPDPNETGARGSLLMALLAQGKTELPNWSVEREPAAYANDRGIEALALWLLDQGANPWAESDPLAVWKLAVTQGHGDLMRRLMSHAQAPDASVLESVELLVGINNLPFSAPSLFAYRNQIDALNAWAGLGFGVNLEDDYKSPGARALTPEFLTAWATAGGNLGTTVGGKPLPSAWSRLPTDRKLKMEKIWQGHQPPLALSPAEAVDVFLADAQTPLFSRRPLKEIKFRLSSLGLKWDTAGRDGKPLRQSLQELFLENPLRFSGSQAGLFLEKASDEVYATAVVAGLRAQAQRGVRPSGSSTAFPVSVADVFFSSHWPSPAAAFDGLLDALSETPSATGRVVTSWSSLHGEGRLSQGLEERLEEWLGSAVSLDRWKTLARLFGSDSWWNKAQTANALALLPAFQGSPWKPWLLLLGDVMNVRTDLASAHPYPEELTRVLSAAMPGPQVSLLIPEGKETASVLALFQDAIVQQLTSSDRMTDEWKNQVKNAARALFLDFQLPSSSSELSPRSRF